MEYTMKKRGKFIVLEGGEGSGKGTILDYLSLVLAGNRVTFTREPGGTAFAERVRALILDGGMVTKAELLLFEAGRADHLEQKIIPALEAGIHVISDRFDASTFAYQVEARWLGKHADFFNMVNDGVVGKMVPDLYLFCDVKPEIALKRRMSAGGEITRFDTENLAFHERVYRGYKKFFKNKPHVMIDATRDKETVCKAAEAVVRTTLGL